MLFILFLRIDTYNIICILNIILLVLTKQHQYRDHFASIGLATKGYSVRKDPGWEIGSCGYHADDGGVFLESDYNASMTWDKCIEGDIMGCGVNLITREVFFTRNGQIQGTYDDCIVLHNK